LKPDALSLVIGVDEHYASLFQSCTDHCRAGPVRFMLTVLEPAHRAAADAGTFGEFLLGPVEESASRATLFRVQHGQKMTLVDKKVKIIQIS
jgi:hypothetical protein